MSWSPWILEVCQPPMAISLNTTTLCETFHACRALEITISQIKISIINPFMNHFGKASPSMWCSLPAAATLHAVQKTNVFSQTTNDGFTFTHSATSARGKSEAINKITYISFFSILCRSSYVYVWLFPSPALCCHWGPRLSSLPNTHSLSAHSQCYATANYFHSARWRGREREKGTRGGVSN